MVRLIRPATPGFLTTLAATIILALVSFSVPYFKSIYFLRAGISQSGVSGSVTFGVLGYCLEFNAQTTCSNATVGWEFNPNALLGNDLPIQIPTVVVRWITYALVLHIVAFGLAGVSALFGLLAHVREMSMSCFSSCISGMAAAVCLVAFIFDLVLFFAVRARVNAIQGGSATIGNGLWLTLAAWVLLFFAGCMFTFGRCCCSKRPKIPRNDSETGSGKYDQESERMRLDAVKAEADRKARQKAGQQEVGLPAFYEHERTPLRNEPQYYEEEVEVGPYADGSKSSRATTNAGGYRPNRAYEPGAPGTRTVDDYYNGTAPEASTAAANTYPPQQRQPSQHRQGSQHQQAYEPQRYRSPSHDAYAQQSFSAVAAPQTYQNQAYDPYQQQSQQPGQYADPYAAQQAQPQQYVDPYLAYAERPALGHQAGGSSYYSASSQQQYPSYQQDPYATSSYNPHAATMSPPEATHYRGLDMQQAHNAAAQQMYAQPEPVHYDQPAAHYDPYGEHQQGHSPVRQPTMPQPNVQSGLLAVDEPPRMFVASPRPMESPPYTPAPQLAVNTAVPPAPRGPRSAGAGPSQRWNETQEGSSEGPPPQYSADGVSSGYPVEKQNGHSNVI